MHETRLTTPQRNALDILRHADYLPGVACVEQSATLDGQAWINWRTAEALERRGLVRIENHDRAGEEWEIWPA